jgi:site-specific DNA recombinase
MRAAILCRMSTDEQGASLSDQEAEGRSFAAAQGWPVVEVYAEARSGYKPGTARPELDRMLRDAAAGRFDVLVVWRLNRLSRQKRTKSAAAIVWQLEDLGVQVHSLKEQSTGVDMVDDLLRVVASHQGAAESKVKSEDTQRGKLRSIKQRGVFHGGFAPYGYRRAGTMPSPDKPQKNIIVYEADPERADVIAELFRRYLAGESPHQIASDFERRSVEPPKSTGVSANPQARRSAPVWQAATVRNLLRNPLLGGWASYKGERVKSCGCVDECEHPYTRSLNIPALVDEDTWEAAQQQVSARRGRVFGGKANGGASRTFLLLGLLWCQECGERLVCRKARQTNVVDRYVCAGRRRKDCTMPTIPRELLDEAIRSHFVSEHVVDTEASIRAERDRLLALRSSEADLIRDELLQVEEELAKVQRLRRKAQLALDDEDITFQQWSRLDADYDAREQLAEGARSRLRDKLTAAEGSVPVDQLDAILDAVSSARRMIAGALEAEDVPRMNAKLHTVFDSIVVGRRSKRLTVVPHLRSEAEASTESATSRILDFGSDTSEGVEIGATLGQVVMRQVELVDDPYQSLVK